MDQVTDSINVLDVSNWEINRVYRFTPNHAGWTVEPLIGLRFMKLMDVYRRDTYLRFDANGAIVPDLPPPGAATATAEQLTTRNATFTNNGFGGQVGARFWKKIGRVNYTAQMRVFGMHNQQNFHRFIDVITTEGAQGNDGAVVVLVNLCTLFPCVGVVVE